MTLAQFAEVLRVIYEGLCPLVRFYEEDGTVVDVRMPFFPSPTGWTGTFDLGPAADGPADKGYKMDMETWVLKPDDARHVLVDDEPRWLDVARETLRRASDVAWKGQLLCHADIEELVGPVAAALRQAYVDGWRRHAMDAAR